MVEAIYEPPQQADRDAAEGFEQLEDPMEDMIKQLAQMCGLQKVGWIFRHPPRKAGFVLLSAEIIMTTKLFRLKPFKSVSNAWPWWRRKPWKLVPGWCFRTGHSKPERVKQRRSSRLLMERRKKMTLTRGCHRALRIMHPGISGQTQIFFNDKI